MQPLLEHDYERFAKDDLSRVQQQIDRSGALFVHLERRERVCLIESRVACNRFNCKLSLYNSELRRLSTYGTVSAQLTGDCLLSLDFAYETACLSYARCAFVIRVGCEANLH